MESLVTVGMLVPSSMNLFYLQSFGLPPPPLVPVRHREDQRGRMTLPKHPLSFFLLLAPPALRPPFTALDPGTSTLHPLQLLCCSSSGRSSTEVYYVCR
jgi:hypothetical protein